MRKVKETVSLLCEKGCGESKKEDNAVEVNGKMSVVGEKKKQASVVRVIKVIE